jgi:Domain of unknown function (DUF4412)
MASMKMKGLLAVAALALSASVASAQFEGEADFKIISHREKKAPLEGTSRMYVAPTGFRMEWSMKTGSSGKSAPTEIKMTMLASLPNPEKVYLVNDENKTYSVWDTKTARESPDPKETYKVEKLGTERIAGYTCQNARVTSSKKNEFDVCVTKEFGPSTDWIAAMNRNDPEARSWLKALRDQGVEGFPIRWAVREKGSTQPTTVMELVSARKKSLAASLFKVPAGYKQTDFAVGGLTPEQEKAMGDAQKQMKEAMEDMTPEQRKQVEEMMKRYGQPTPVP